MDGTTSDVAVVLTHRSWVRISSLLLCTLDGFFRKQHKTAKMMKKSTIPTPHNDTPRINGRLSPRAVAGVGGTVGGILAVGPRAGTTAVDIDGSLLGIYIGVALEPLGITVLLGATGGSTIFGVEVGVSPAFKVFDEVMGAVDGPAPLIGEFMVLISLLDRSGILLDLRIGSVAVGSVSTTGEVIATFPFE